MRASHLFQGSLMISMTRRALSTSALAFAAGCASSGATSSASAPRAAAIGAFGLDLTAGDGSVKPGDDFFRYCNGHWLDTTEIPGDRVSWGAFAILRDKSERDVRAIIEGVSSAGGAPGS